MNLDGVDVEEEKGAVCWELELEDVPELELGTAVSVEDGTRAPDEFELELELALGVGTGAALELEVLEAVSVEGMGISEVSLGTGESKEPDMELRVNIVENWR